MNVRELIKKIRVTIDEKVHSINGSDSMISDETIIDCINQGIIKFEQMTAMSVVSPEDNQFNITLIENQDLYELPSKIRQVTLPVIFDGNIKKYLTKTSAETIGTNTLHGTPSYFSLDYKPGFIKVAPIPLREYNLSFMGVVKSNRVSLKNQNDELPYDEDYHYGFMYYACYLCMMQIGNDNGNVKQFIGYYNNMWNQIYLDAKRDQQNKYMNIDSLFFKNVDYRT